MSLGKPMGKLDTLLQVGRTFGMRDGMLRLQYELQRGSGLLSWRMRSVQGWDSWDLKKIAPGSEAEEMRLHAGMEASNFSLPIRKPWERASKKLSDVTEKPPFSLKRNASFRAICRSSANYRTPVAFPGAGFATP